MSVPPIPPTAPTVWPPSSAPTLPRDATGVPYAGFDPNTGQVPIEAFDGQIVALGALGDAAATDNTSNWSGIALLKSIRSRLGSGTTDGQIRSGIGGLLHYLLNPSGTADAQRSLGATGAQLGVALVAGSPSTSSSTTPGGSISTSSATPTTIFTSTELAGYNRALIIGTSLNQAVTILVKVQTGATSGSANGAWILCQFQIAAGNVNNQGVIVTTAGIKVLSGGTAPTITIDVSGAFNAPFTTVTVAAYVGAAATGSLWVDYQATT